MRHAGFIGGFISGALGGVFGLPIWQWVIIALPLVVGLAAANDAKKVAK